MKERKWQSAAAEAMFEFACDLQSTEEINYADPMIISAFKTEQIYQKSDEYSKREEK